MPAQNKILRKCNMKIIKLLLMISLMGFFLSNCSSGKDWRTASRDSAGPCGAGRIPTKLAEGVTEGGHAHRICPAVVRLRDHLGVFGQAADHVERSSPSTSSPRTSSAMSTPTSRRPWPCSPAIRQRPATWLAWTACRTADHRPRPLAHS